MTTTTFDPRWIVPDWTAPAHVRALITTRSGGASSGPWGARDGGGMNVGLSCGDVEHAVLSNRARLAAMLPQPPRWLHQVHGAAVVQAESVQLAAAQAPKPVPPRADASTSISPGVVCAVQIADCMPVLLSDAAGTVVGAVHAGWRGLAAGVIQNTVRAMRERASRQAHIAERIMAYLGPAIGPQHFEVGADVLEAMQAALPNAASAFAPAGAGKYHADLFELGRQALAQVGVDEVFGATHSTYGDPERFYSFRRDRVTGRHVALIWIESTP